MALRQMGQPVDLRAAIPNLNQRMGPNAYDDALRQRLQAVAGIGTQQNAYSAMKAQQAQQAAYQSRLNEINNQQIPNWQMSGGGPRMAPNGKWLAPTSDKVIFGYGAKYSAKNAAITGSPTHRGLDFGGKAGDPIYAPAAGTLVGLGGGGAWNSGRGNYLSAQFGQGGPYGLFEHLQNFAPGIKAGMQITPGMLLGYMGSTGNANGVNHLHFETRYDLNDPGTSFDPSAWFGW